jgi:multicomponent Na+:H+ antiporter subunit B
MESLINIVLLTLLAVVTVGIVFQRNLFAVVVLAGIYSFLMASVLIVLDAVDVAMTEASVGAGVSTVLLLGTLHLVKSIEYPSRRSALVPMLVAGVTGAALVWATFGLSPFGAADTPIHTHVAPKYLADSIRETHVPNVVTSTLADYRGYDTLGETTVIFTAGIGVLILLQGRLREKDPEMLVGSMHEETIPRVVIKLILPFILLFGLYVFYHGESGPGGGFQAGVIVAAGVILYGLIHGLSAARRIAPMRLLEIMIPLGVFIYGSVGILGLVFGGNYLDYFVLDKDPVHGQERGIFWVETGVVVTVAGTMTAIYYAFSGRGR